MKGGAYMCMIKFITNLLWEIVISVLADTVKDALMR